MLAAKTRDKILDYGLCGHDVKIGKYYYFADVNTGGIWRCREDDVGKVWLRPDGTRVNGWRKIGQLDGRYAK